MDYFKRFVKEEYEWVYSESCDAVQLLLKNLEGKVSEQEFDDYFDMFTSEAMQRYTNNEYVIQSLHEIMDDCLTEVLQEYAENKEEFIKDYKLDDRAIRYEIEEEIENAYKTLTLYDISEDVLMEKGYLDKKKNNDIEELIDSIREDLYNYNDEIDEVEMTVATRKSEDEVSFIQTQYSKNRKEKKETTCPNWIRDLECFKMKNRD